MVVKIVFLFLAFMGVLAMFGRWKVPGARHLERFRSKQLEARKCPSCGRYRIGGGTCPCGKGKR